jgi:hypothetical protein
MNIFTFIILGIIYCVGIILVLEVSAILIVALLIGLDLFLQVFLQSEVYRLMKPYLKKQVVQKRVRLNEEVK